MFIDTHCHLTDKYTDGLDAVIQNEHNANVGVMICPTADPNDIDSALRISFSRFNTKEEVDTLIEELKNAVTKLKRS